MNRNMFNGCGEVPQPAFSTEAATPAIARQSRRHAFVEIVEQPASKVRFRYKCEGQSVGSILGASSTSKNKTFPTIRVVGYQGPAVVVVSCVTKDKPYRPHPHSLIGKERCKKGICTLEISQDTMSATISNIGIQCVKKKDIENALEIRDKIRVDPFMTGFDHRNNPSAIDLNAVRLCFQVFIEGERRGRFTVPLTPVVSDPIFNKKAVLDLEIVKLSHCTSYVDGGTNEIILLCKKVSKDDIQVRFYEEENGQVVWEGYGDFQPTQVYEHVAISFRPPRYRTLDITEPVRVFIQLRRPSDDACSEALPFEFLPIDSEPGMRKRKRQRFDEAAQRLRQSDETERTTGAHSYVLNIPTEGIKSEPRNQIPVNMNLPSTAENALVGVLQQYWKLGPVNDVSRGNSDRSHFSSASGISSILSLDNQECMGNLSGTCAQNLSLDSGGLTNLINSTLDRMCQSPQNN